MKPLALRYGRQAEEDLIEIWDYVAQHDVRAADRLLRELETRLKLLSDYPLAGRTREDMLEGTRYLVVQNYLIFYRVDDGAVDIIRILHGRRNISAEDISA